MEYNRNFEEHTISSTVIATRQQTLYSNKEFLQEALPYRNLGLAGRLTYSFRRRYFIEGNFGYNGSERFSANHRYGFFQRSVRPGWYLTKAFGKAAYLT
ncbi:hypothetical protein LWM68_14225 [Niabella sp. W65]|nr:hypothetical protein [Niabella sp. W65]MCH7363803.1 hypothetical protein [Niabella sp. W65]ULT39707.1 hypothetical protein KRR40_33045 [Niabella sp. I65]